MSSFYTDEELSLLGFKSYGKNVLISKKCSIYSAETISIGDNVRIDDFCILSGSIKLGSHIHIAAYCALYGSMGIKMNDYTGLSPRCTIFSAMDDFLGDYLIGPIHDSEKTNVIGGLVILEKYVQIGSDTILFPNITIAEGTVVGAKSLIKNSTLPWMIYAGSPAKFIKNRNKGLLGYL